VYGYDVIAPLVPEEHTRLITHMRKLSERAARRKAAGVQDGRSVANQDFDDMMESDEDDSDDDRTFMTGVTGFTRMTNMSGKVTKRSAMDRSIKNMSVISGAMSAMTGKSVKGNKGPRIKAELNGEILDMLDASKMARSVRFADVDMDRRDFSDNEEDDGMDDMHFDTQGIGLLAVMECQNMEILIKTAAVMRNTMNRMMMKNVSLKLVVVGVESVVGSPSLKVSN